MAKLYDELFPAMQARRAIKEYDTTLDVTDEDLWKIFEFTNTSPTAKNIQCWRAITIKRGELKDEISETLPSFNLERSRTASAILIFLYKKEAWFDRSDEDFYEKAKHRAGVLAETFNYELTQEKIDEYIAGVDRHAYVWGPDRDIEQLSASQTYIAFSWAIIGAESLGIKTTPVTGFEQSTIRDILTKRGLMDPEKEDVGTFVFLGYTDGAKQPFFGSGQVRVPTKEKFKIIEE